MKFDNKLSVFLFGFIILVWSCKHAEPKIEVSKTTTIETKIDSVLGLLTLEEKVAMCHAQSKFSTKGVERLGIPEIWMADGPHGVRAEISWDDWAYAGWTNDSITAFPALTCLARI